MNEHATPTGTWLAEEMQAINIKMAATLNGRLKPELESYNDELQEIMLKFPLQDWQVNGLGTLHGGMIYAMMDLTMCMAVFCYSRETIPPTISMTVNYMRPIPMSDYILAKARVTHIGKRNACAYCEIIIPANKKIASSSIGTYAIIPK